MRNTAILLVSCPDGTGLVARISDFIFRRGGNILDFDQHTDLEAGVFLARVEWTLSGFRVSRGRVTEAFEPVAAEYGMDFEIHSATRFTESPSSRQSSDIASKICSSAGWQTSFRPR